VADVATRFDKPKFHFARHVTSRHDTFDVSSVYILAVSSLSNGTARHVRHDEPDTLDTSNVSCRAETWRDEPSGIWAIAQLSFRSAGHGFSSHLPPCGKNLALRCSKAIGR